MATLGSSKNTISLCDDDHYPNAFENRNSNKAQHIHELKHIRNSIHGRTIAKSIKHLKHISVCVCMCVYMFMYIYAEHMDV